MTSFLVCVQSGSGSGRDGKFGFAHTPEGHVVCVGGWGCVCRREGNGKRRGSLSLGDSEKLEVQVLGEWWPDSIAHLWFCVLNIYIPHTLYAQVCFYWLVQAPQPPCDSSRQVCGWEDVIWKVCFQQEHAYCMYLLKFIFYRSSVIYFNYSR